jgi:hypothetical protein
MFPCGIVEQIGGGGKAKSVAPNGGRLDYLGQGVMTRSHFDKCACRQKCDDLGCYVKLLKAAIHSQVICNY